MPAKTETRTRSVWSGPTDPGPQGGVTVSLLQKYLSCRARFKCYAVEGWKAAPRFNHKIFYGNLFHRADEVYSTTGDLRAAADAITLLAEEESELHPQNREEVRKWWNVCQIQFPEYLKFWNAHPDTHRPLLQEQVFDVPYRLPSGRVVRLRGKWDGVTAAPDNSIWNYETKTKGDVDELAIERQLKFDLQTMTYLVALNGAKFHRLYDLTPDTTLGGVRYNVVRRPLSGGKGTIVRHKPTKGNPLGESEDGYYARLRQYIADEPGSYFYRWVVDVMAGDINTFRREFLDPCLEFLCDWYGCVVNYDGAAKKEVQSIGMNWRTPFGLTQTIADGFGSDLDHFLETGSSTGLVRTDNLFGELV